MGTSWRWASAKLSPEPTSSSSSRLELRRRKTVSTEVFGKLFSKEKWDEKWTLYCIYLFNFLNNRLEMIDLKILLEKPNPSFSKWRGREGIAEWVDGWVDINQAISIIPQRPGNNLQMKAWKHYVRFCIAEFSPCLFVQVPLELWLSTGGCMESNSIWRQILVQRGF